MNQTIKLHHSFYGVEFQTILSIIPIDKGHRFNCTIEEACESNGRTIIEATSVYHNENVIESNFYVAEQTETDSFSQDLPFSDSDHVKALLKMNHLSTEIISAFFNISSVEVKTLLNDETISFKDFIRKNIEHFI